MKKIRPLLAVPAIASVLIVGIMMFKKPTVTISLPKSPVRASCQSLPIKSLGYRDELGEYLNELGFTTGAELGVQRGHYSEKILQTWEKCQRYYLVDVWRQQNSYKDIANVDDDEQEKIYNEAKSRLGPWDQKTVFVRKFTSDAMSDLPTQLDFIYVDARHDYCGVSEDIENYWPKVREGGIMAGHDYVRAEDVIDQDWSLCANGTRATGAVKGAVDEFAQKHDLQVSVTYKEANWYTWVVRKPICSSRG